jgi:RNA polymerase sigma-70 factor (ECF subfamily)
MTDATTLLLAWRRGDDAALGELISIVYQELRRTAHRYLAGQRPGHTLQTTALVHEAYLQLVDCRQVRWQDRSHFLAVTARLMRRILVDYARARNAEKRGGSTPAAPLDENLDSARPQSADLITLNDSLEALATVDQRKSEVVELKFFGGLETREIAEVLGISEPTVLRDWKLAKAWLLRELSRT